MDTSYAVHPYCHALSCSVLASARLLALTAGNVQNGAVDRRDPQVGGPSVKHNLEPLPRCSNGDISIILGLQDTHTNDSVRYGAAQGERLCIHVCSV